MVFFIRIMGLERLNSKRLGDYVVIVAMESRHRSCVLSLSPSMRIRFVGNVKDPYFMNNEGAWKVYKQIREKVVKLFKSL
jgi:protein-tyrosine-phosphatase